MTVSVHELYENIWGKDDPDFEADVSKSLNPRASSALYDLFGELGVNPDSVVLDIGCRDAAASVKLAQRFGCRVVAIDNIPLHMEKAAKCISEAGLQDRITAKLGSIEVLPLEDGSIDLVWCRDMLNHVDLPAGLRECYRVLKPGGTMFIYMTQATEMCEPKETARICAAQAIVLENMSPRTLETTAQAAGFILVDRQVIGSEWREAALESGEDKDSLAEDLLRISRMRRQEADLVEKYGRARYEAAYAEAHWFLYILLGKLNPTVYVLKKPD